MAHVRRTNPRDAKVAGLVSLHRMIRRGTAYGPPLPEGVLMTTARTWLMFSFVGAHIGRQFEFVQSGGSTAVTSRPRRREGSN